MLKQFITVAIFGICSVSLSFSQQEHQPKKFTAKKINQYTPNNKTPDFDARIKNVEAPTPGGDSYKSFLLRQKIKGSRLHNKGAFKATNSINMNAPAPTINWQMAMYRYLAPLDTNYLLSGGVPLDNTIAVNNDNILLASVNSYLWGYDLEADTILFKDQIGSTKTISFKEFAGDSISPSNENTFPFDPKLLYDPNHDRFIFAFLDGRGPDDSQIVVGFSNTSDPRDGWSVYAITGNPRDVNEWTDYPALTITENELFVTINLIENNVSWQEGFRGSVIWQMDLDGAYAGNSEVDLQLWDNIKYQGRYLRNLNPVEGPDGPSGPNAYFLSNRNFDVQNDSVFIVEVTNTMQSGEAALNIGMGKLDQPYGVPPNGKQGDTPPGSADSLGLQTNDARWLGAILFEDEIHFVGNTRDFETNNAAVYHGVIDSLNGNRTFTGNIIASDTLDFGYPKLAYTGMSDCDNTYMIGFNHTSPTFHPGVSAIYYNHNTREYSPRVTLKRGEGVVDKQQGATERWGDYFGIQRVYNNPGTVYTGGFYGKGGNQSNTWLSKLTIAPAETSDPQLAVDTTFSPANRCEVKLSANVSGGKAPYTFLWNGEQSDSSYTFNGCNGPFELKVIDDWNCEVSMSGNIAEENQFSVGKSRIFPNPVINDLTIDFSMSQQQKVDVYIIDATGKIVKKLMSTSVQEGNNQLIFNTAPLQEGIYRVVIQAGDNQLLEEPFVKLR
ncbi:MAG: T9SS type A sorting domain-containing protein [Salibacter sp.]|uniref:T9SS type A sorting domain-containing protein n=1 Tax=Salibacter sp. TaxID=2010995 RepID=UPI00286FFDC3|nr:T9SS type A sorting domain-containing protein [Salibacter sp.]MDR9398192.1 T9SS type A sorting domain-containing protein [Salibacter sp.]